MLKNENSVEEFGQIEYGSVGDLLESAETGCRLCAMASALMKRGATEGMKWDGAWNSPLSLTVLVRLCLQHGMIVCAFLGQYILQEA
jgi:hypothetical protein